MSINCNCFFNYVSITCLIWGNELRHMYSHHVTSSSLCDKHVPINYWVDILVNDTRKHNYYGEKSENLIINTMTSSKCNIGWVNIEILPKLLQILTLCYTAVYRTHDTVILIIAVNRMHWYNHVFIVVVVSVVNEDWYVVYRLQL